MNQSTEARVPRVRFAPSPTGYLHIGGLRTALYNELFARHHGGIFVLRIEDTDRTRYVEGAVENILRTLKWAGLTPDEGPFLAPDGSVQERGAYGPYVQSARTEKYRHYAEELLGKTEEASGQSYAYRCFCTPEEIESLKKDRASSDAAPLPGLVPHARNCRGLTGEESAALAAESPYVIRLRVPDRVGRVEFTDSIRGLVRFDYSSVDDQVLLKSDGFPTYHLANVVDDHEMEITQVIRGEEWLPSTPKHLLLYRALGWEPPAFAHLPLLLNPDRTKLSKRQGDVAVEDYRAQGYLPQAMINFVALLGWNPSGDREKYSKDELAREFRLEKVNKAGAVFNREKLDWLNGEYMKEMPDEELTEVVIPFLRIDGVLTEVDGGIKAADGSPVDREALRRSVALEKGRAKTLKDFAATTGYFFTSKVELSRDMIPWKKSTPEVAKERLYGLRDRLAGLSEKYFSDPKLLEAEIIPFVAERGWTNADTLWPFRVALSGRERSPSPFEIAWAIGKKRTLERVEAAISLL